MDGDPVDALRHLRADFEVMRQEDITREAQAAHEPVPVSEAAVVAVRAVERTGAPLVSLRPGDDVQVEVDVDVRGSLPGAVVGFAVESTLGQVVYGTNTRLMNLAVPTLAGPSTFTFRLPNLALGEGQYSVTAAIGRANGIEIHRLPQGATFSVHASGRGVGFLEVDTALVGGPGS